MTIKNPTAAVAKPMRLPQTNMIKLEKNISPKPTRTKHTPKRCLADGAFKTIDKVTAKKITNAGATISVYGYS